MAQRNVLAFVKPVKVEVKKVYQKSTTGYTKKGIRCASAADPIPLEELTRIKKYIFENMKTPERNWTLILLGINVGCRCGDLTRLRVGDVWNGSAVKTDIQYMAEKTRTWEYMYIRDDLKPEIEKYIRSLDNQSPGAYLFTTRDGNRLTTKSTYKMFHRISTALKLDFHFSTHSLRKTMGKTVYDQYGLKETREALRQQNDKSTLHYIREDEVERRRVALSLPTIKI